MNIKKISKNLLIVSALATQGVYADNSMTNLMDSLELIDSKVSLKDFAAPHVQKTSQENVSALFENPVTEPVKKEKASTWGSWMYQNATSFGKGVVDVSANIAQKISPVVSTATPVITTIIGKQVFGHYFENIKAVELNALYAQASWAGKTAITLDWANALQQAYEKGQVVGGMVGHFAGNVLVTTGTHVLNGDIFSMEYLANIARNAADTGIRQILVDGTESFVVNTSNYMFRHYFNATAGALLGPAGLAVAIPLSVYLQKSGTLDAGIHMAYNLSASGLRMGAELGAKAAVATTKAAYNGVSATTSYAAKAFSNWWYGSKEQEAKAA